MTETIWQKVTVDPTLREFIRLTPEDVRKLPQEAATKPNPVKWLEGELNRRGQEKKDINERHNRERKERDKAFFLDFASRWPGDTCCVKEQPWVKANGRRFGYVTRSDFEAGRWVVYPYGEESETYASIDALVEDWSVD